MKKWKAIVVSTALLGTLGLSGCGCDDKKSQTPIVLPNYIILPQQDYLEDNNELLIGERLGITYKVDPINTSADYDDVVISFDKTGVVELEGAPERTEGYDTFYVEAVGVGEVTITVSTVHREHKATLTLKVVQQVQLPAPTNVVYDDENISWDNVVGNNGYTLKINNGQEDTLIDIAKDTNSYTFDDYEEGKEYTVSVMAKGVGKAYVDSEYSSEVSFYYLPKVTQYSNDEYILSWQGVENATSYNIYVRYTLRGDSTETYQTSVDATEPLQFDLSSIEGASDATKFEVTVIPQSTLDNVYQNNTFSTYDYVVSKLSTINDLHITNDGTLLDWADISGASTYALKIGEQQFTLSQSQFDLTSLDAGQYTAQVYPLSDDKIKGDVATFVFEKLATVTGVKVQDSKLMFDANANASGYTVQFMNNTDGQVYQYKLTGASSSTISLYDTLKGKTGNYSVNIITLGQDNGEYATSNTLNCDISFDVLPKVEITALKNNNIISDVSNIVLGNSTIIWTKLEQEVTYFVYLQGTDKKITLLESDNGEYQLSGSSYSYTLPSDLDAGSYQIFVRAVGDGVTTISSIDVFGENQNGYTFTKLAQVDHTTFAINSTTQSISWSAVSGAVGYAVTEGDVTTFTTSPTYKVQRVGTSITVVALGKDSVSSVDGSSINSLSSQPYSYDTFDKISNLQTQNGKLYFTSTDDISNATIYAIIDNNQNNPIEVSQEAGVIDIANYLTVAGEHTVQIYLYQNGYIESELSNICTFTMLDTVQELTVEKSIDKYTISFDRDENSNGYYCEVRHTDLDGENKVVSLEDAILGGEIDGSTLEAGTYSVLLKALGTGKYVDSKLSTTFTFVKLPTVVPQASGSKIVWQESSVGNIKATGYDVYVDEIKSNTETIIGTNYTLPASVSAGSHKITIVALSENNNCIDSNMSTDLSFNKLYDATGLAVVNGQFTWTKTDGMTYQVYDGDVILETTNNNYLSVELVAGKVYNLSVVVTRPNNISSNKSTTLSLQKLPTITEMSIANNTITFVAPKIGDVEYASKYEVYEITEQGNNLIQTIENTGAGSYSFEIYKTEPNTYRYVVIAVGSTSATSSGYVTSNAGSGLTIDVLPTVNTGSLVVSGGKLSWEDIETDINFDHYLLTVYGRDTDGTIDCEGNGTMYSKLGEYNMGHLTSYDFSQYEGGVYYVTLQVIGNNADILDSSVTGYFRVEKLLTPAVTLNNGVINFVGPDNTTGYAYHLFNGDVEVTLQDNLSTIYIDDSMQSLGTYTYTLYVSKDGFVDSNISLPLTVKRLDTVKNIKIESITENEEVAGLITRLSWDAVENATGYKIVVFENGEPTNIVIDVIGKDLHSYDIENIDSLSGSVDIAIIAIGNTVIPNTNDAVIDGYINSKYSDEVTINTLGQVENVRLEDGKLKWDALQNASQYKVVVKNANDDSTVDTQYVTGTEYSFDNVVSNGEFDVYVYAWGYINGNQGYISNSNPTILAGLIKDDVITNEKVSIKNGVFEWTITLKDIKDCLAQMTNSEYLEDSRVLSLFRDVTRKVIKGDELSTEQNITATGPDDETVTVCSEQEFFNAIRHLITINVQYSALSTAGDSASYYNKINNQTVTSFDYNTEDTASDSLAIRLIYDFESSEGYYKIAFGNVGNSGNAESEYTLRIAGNMLQEYTVYKAVAPSCVTLEGEQITGYTFNNNVYFNRVFYTDPQGVEKESNYVIELKYIQNNVEQSKEFVVETDSGYLKDGTDNESAHYGCVPFGDIITALNLPTQTSFSVRVRVLGTVDSAGQSVVDNVFALRSNYVDNTSVQVLIRPTLSIKDGQVAWAPSSIAYFQVLRIYRNGDGELIDTALLRDVAKEMYPNLTNENVDTVLYGGGIKLPSNKTSEFSSQVLAKNEYYDLTIQEYGNGINTITAQESAKRTFVTLGNSVSDITLDQTGRYVFSCINAARITVYKSSSINGPFEQAGVHYIEKESQGETQFVFELPQTYAAFDDSGKAIYYKIGVQDAPTEDSPMAIVGEMTLDDQAYTRFDSVENIRVDGFNIVWDSVELVNGYEITINNKTTIEVNGGTEYSLEDDELYPAGDYVISVRAQRTIGESHIIGIASTATVHKLASPTLRLNNGDVLWDLANTSDVEGQNVHVVIRENDNVLFEQDMSYPHSAFVFADQVDQEGNPLFVEGNTYQIEVYQVAKPDTLNISSTTATMTVQYLGTTTLDYGQNGSDATLNFAQANNAVGYQLVSTTFNLVTDEGGTQTEQFVKKYVYNIYTAGDIGSAVINSVVYSEYTFDSASNAWIANKENQAIANIASVVTYNSETSTFSFFTANINQGLPQGNINYRSQVRVLGSTATATESGTKYVSGAFSNVVDTAVPQTPINIQFDSTTGYVSWTNVRDDYRPYINYTMNINVNDSYNSFENIVSRVESAGYTQFDIVRKIGEVEVSYTDDEWTNPNSGDTISVKITMRLEKGDTQYRLTNIGSYSEIAMYSESDTYEKSQLSATQSAQLSVFAAGNGTENNPYQISNATQLQNMRQFATGKYYFMLTQDISLSSWTTIDDFDGYLNLNSNTITYMASSTFITLNSTGEIYGGNIIYDANYASKFIVNNAGNIRDLHVEVKGKVSSLTSNFSLFGNNTGEINNINLTLNNFEINCSSTESLIIGVLTNRNDGTISNINITGNIKVTSQRNVNIALVSYRNGTSGFVSRVVSQANITSDTSQNGTITIAGLVNYNYGSVVDSGTSGTITAKYANIAGLVYNNYSIVDSCYNTGSIVVTGNNANITVAGLVGIMYVSDGSQSYTPTLKNSYTVLQNVSLTNNSSNATIYFGGLIGSNRTSALSSITNCYVIVDNITKNTTGQYNIGLVVAQNNGGGFSQVYYQELETYSHTGTGVGGSSNGITNTTNFTQQSEDGQIKGMIESSGVFEKTKSMIQVNDTTYYIYILSWEIE